MSQEINLLNLALRPKQDWLSFRSVSVATAASLLLVLALFTFARFDLAGKQQAQSAAAARQTAAQQELQNLQTALGTRKTDPALELEAAALSAAAKQRGEVLALAKSLAADGGTVANIMRGFSRQRIEGVWLTGFNVGPAGFDMRGRLLDPALLPAYIRRLNAEPAFRGRNFAALDMQGVVPQPVVAAQNSVPVPTVPAPAGPLRYTEFALKATAGGSSEKGGKE